MDLKAFTQDHLIEITATAALVGYALIRKKLTPDGIAAAVFVAAIHMLHPWRAFFWLPIIFFLLGTTVTKVRVSFRFSRSIYHLLFIESQGPLYLRYIHCRQSLLTHSRSATKPKPT